MIPGTILLVLWAPDVVAANLFRKGLLVVDPPKPHRRIAAANELRRIKCFWFVSDRLALSDLHRRILPVAQRGSRSGCTGICRHLSQIERFNRHTQSLRQFGFLPKSLDATAGHGYSKPFLADQNFRAIGMCLFVGFRMRLAPSRCGNLLEPQDLLV